MSRAFVKEDTDGPEKRYTLPDRDDPGYDESAAWALLEGANEGDSRSAELATGYKWGEDRLKPYVQQIGERAEEQGEERLATLARRFLRA